MRVKDFLKSFQAFTEILRASHANEVFEGLTKINELFVGKEAMTMAAFIKLALPDQTLRGDGQGFTVAKLEPSLIQLKQFSDITAKKAFSDDLGKLIELLKMYSTTSIDQFIDSVKTKLESSPKATKRAGKPLNLEIVNLYSDRLASSYEDAIQFYEVFNELKSNKEVRKQEAAAISNKFAFSTPPSTAKKVSLERIERVHSSQMDIVRKSQYKQSAA